MHASRTDNAATARTTRRLTAVGLPLLIVAWGLVTWAGSLDGAFMFDDERYVLGDHRIQQVTPLLAHLKSRRPVVSVSLALNHAAGGTDPTGYHLINVAIHLLAGLALYGVLRRIGTQHPAGVARPLRCAALAGSVALLWVVHPLQTESVTYVVQRAESLMGLFFLLAMYAAIRRFSSGGRLWSIIAVSAAALAMGSKAVAVTLPVLILLIDGVFFAPGFRAALRQRRGFYVALAATWLVLLLCGVVTGVLGLKSVTTATVGFGYSGVTPLAYLATQPEVVLHYLRLALWPHPLCLDYGWAPASAWREIVVPATAILVLVALSAWGVARRRWWGVAGAWIFVILAPTSSFIPIRDLAFEHRMYLSLAGVAVIVVGGGWLLLDRLARGLRFGERTVAVIGASLILVAAAALSAATISRNRVWSDPVAMWEDVTRQRPDHGRGWLNLARALQVSERSADAVAACRRGLAVAPEDDHLHCRLGLLHYAAGRKEEAIHHLERATRDAERPYLGIFEAWRFLGEACLDLGRAADAEEAWLEALRYRPADPVLRNNLGLVYARRGDLPRAREHFEIAARVRPDDVEILGNMGLVLLDLGLLDEATSWFRRVQKIDPQNPLARQKLQQIAALRPERDSGTER